MLLRRIAVGGMAELFLASEPRASRYVVLKRILPHLAKEPEFVKMFLDEARIAGLLHHPNVAEVYELGHLDQSIFISMEWVEGMDLRRILQKEQGRGGVVPPGIAAWVVARLCEGLHYAHSREGDDHKPIGIIHRDVSPQNIMVSYQGEVKLVDFGIAKATAWVSRSKPGVIKGKFLYLSPEQLSEEPLDSRCDLFALGTMLYELTTGKSPFYRPETEGVIYSIRVEDPPPPHTLRSGYPLSLSRVVMKCLVKDREHRYQTADEVRVALEDALLLEMPTTKNDVVSYIEGLFGDGGERTGVYVPENAQVPVKSLGARKALPAAPKPSPPTPAPALEALAVPPAMIRRAPPTLADESGERVLSVHTNEIHDLDEGDPDDEMTASMPVPRKPPRVKTPAKPPPPVARPSPATPAGAATVPLETSERTRDDVPTMLNPMESPPENTAPMGRGQAKAAPPAAKPAPPVPDAEGVLDLSYESVAKESPAGLFDNDSEATHVDDDEKDDEPTARNEPLPRQRAEPKAPARPPPAEVSEPSVRVDPEALRPLTKSEEAALAADFDPPPDDAEPSVMTELQIPTYPPVMKERLVRPAPPVSDDATKPPLLDPLRKERERPAPPIDSGSRGAVSRGISAAPEQTEFGEPFPGAGQPGLLPHLPTPPPPKRPTSPWDRAKDLSPPVPARRPKRDSTRMSPLDPVTGSELERLREAQPADRRARRIVKRPVAQDPDDHVATVDFRDSQNELADVDDVREGIRPRRPPEREEEQFDDEYDAAEGTSPWLVATTLLLGVLAMVLVTWLLWPTAPTPAPLRPSRVPPKEASGGPAPAPAPPVRAAAPAPRTPSLVNVQFRAARSTLIFIEGVQLTPNEIRAMPPGPLTLNYRCLPTKRGVLARDLTFSTVVPTSTNTPFIIDLSCK